MPGGWHLSRRDFLVLAAATWVAGCGQAGNATVRPTATPAPKPLIPASPVEPGNAALMTRLATFSPEDSSIGGIAWSPDGSVVAAGGAREIHLWDVRTGAKVGTWKGHQEPINCLAWSRANGMLASSSSDGTVRLWDLRQGATVRILGGPANGEVFGLAWSPEGNRLVSGLAGGHIMLWDVTTGQHLATWTGPALQGARGTYPYAVWSVAWSPDGKRIASVRNDTKVLVWDAESGKNMAVLIPDSIPYKMAWEPSGDLFATENDDGTVQIWDAAHDDNVAVLGGRDGDGWACSAAWTPDGRVLASSRQTGSVQLWDMTTGMRLATFPAHENAIWAIAWSPDGLRLATGSDDESVSLWGVR